MSNALDELIAEKTQIIFDGSYKPNEDEILKIENYQLSDEIKDAIRDPLGVPSFKKDNDTFPEIKAIFVGERTEDGETEKFNVVFQRFRKEQYISTKWCNLFFENNTFFQEKRFGISIADGVDCYYTDKELQFSSFYYARQIFDLSECYRSATDSEVESFTTSSKLALDNSEAFKGIGSEVHIDMFDDRIEIYSPGGMVSGISLEGKDLLKIPSKRRNPILADIFSRLKYMERRGSGFKKILADYEGQVEFDETKMPVFEADNDDFTLILTRFFGTIPKFV